MQKSEEKLNKQQSKYYVEHACQISSTGTVAAELELEPSRISELRGGRRQLTIAQAEIIKKIYGLPSTSEGHWMECELLSSIDLHKQFIDNGLTLHFLHICKTINSETLINSIVDLCYFHDESVPGYNSIVGLYDKDYSEARKANELIFKNYKLKFFNQLLVNDSFQAFCGSGCNDLDLDALSEICCKINPKFSFAVNFNKKYQVELFNSLRFLLRFRDLVLSKTYANLVSFEAGFYLGGNFKIDTAASPKKEYVVVGKVVWEIGSEYSAVLKRPIMPAGVCGLLSSHKEQHHLKKIHPEILTHFSVKLYYSECYKYLLELNLFEDDRICVPARRLLIEIVDRQKVFDEIFDVFNYFQIDTGWTIKDIKYAIAQNGGYIPGATYLD